eukprot:766999-Hanusia_phi.AAC.2
MFLPPNFQAILSIAQTRRPMTKREMFRAQKFYESANRNVFILCIFCGCISPGQIPRPKPSEVHSLPALLFAWWVEPQHGTLPRDTTTSRM